MMTPSEAIIPPNEVDESDAWSEEQKYEEAVAQGIEEVDSGALASSFAPPDMFTQLESTAPWDLYTKTMFNHFGFPLWHADPEHVRGFAAPREVNIGSVGYINKGKFRHFFNAMKEAYDPLNNGKVPPDFIRFNPRNMTIIDPAPILRKPYVASGYVRQVARLMDGSAISPVSNLVFAGGNLSFECKQDTGAFLALDQPAYGQSIPTKRHIVTYLYRHMDKWLQWVNEELGHELQMHDIKFVSGTLKTTKWACTVFSGSYRNKKGSLKVSAGGVGDLYLNVSIENHSIPSEFHNNGPVSEPTDTGDARRASIDDGDDNDDLLPASEDALARRGSTSSPLSLKRDQCIFFHYYTMKKRQSEISHKFEATAGLHELVPEDSEMEENSPLLAATEDDTESDTREFPSVDATEGAKFDPVVDLLDYMLAKTGADYAIASDRDVLAIFGVKGIPDDVKAGLEAANPPIDIDENNVATVNVDMTWLDQQTCEEIEEVSGQPSSTEPTGDTLAALAEPEAEQISVDPVAADVAQAEGEEGEGGDNDNDNDDDDAEAARRVKQAVWEPAVNAHTGSVTSLAFSPDSQWVASGSDDTMIILWEAETQSVVRKWESHDDIVWHLAFSPDSLRLASSGGEGRIMVWDVDTGEQLAILEGHTETIHTVVWSPDGTKLASGSDDMSVRIWDAQAYEQLHLLEGHNAMVTFVLFSHNGQYLASGGADYNTRIWDVATGALHKELRGHRGMVWTGSFDAEDNRIATASDDGSVRIWKVETGEELVMLHEHHGPVWVVSFSPGDGKHILSGSSDSTLKICDSFTGERVVALEGHDSMINSATFSPDGRYVASASSDNTVRLWRRSDGTNMKTFNEHNDKVTHTLFSPDGEMLASGSDDGTVRIRVLKDFVKLD